MPHEIKCYTENCHKWVRLYSGGGGQGESYMKVCTGTWSEELSQMVVSRGTNF